MKFYRSPPPFILRLWMLLVPTLSIVDRCQGHATAGLLSNPAGCCLNPTLPGHMGLLPWKDRFYNALLEQLAMGEAVKGVNQAERARSSKLTSAALGSTGSGPLMVRVSFALWSTTLNFAQRDTTTTDVFGRLWCWNHSSTLAGGDPWCRNLACQQRTCCIVLLFQLEL